MNLKQRFGVSPAKWAIVFFLSVIQGAFLTVSKAANQSQLPDFVCEPMKEYDPGMCLSAGDGDPQGPLAGRIPVILIHGWNPKEVAGEPDLSVWEGLARHLYESRWFREKYKMYFLVYLSNIKGQSIRDMGLTFRSLLNQMDQADTDFRGKPLVMIGHSMGGLIARSYMQEPRFGSAGSGGDRVLRLITLGTPHHGSPIANGPARDKKADKWFDFVHQFIEGGLFGFEIDWDEENRSDLRWDNYDGLLDYGRYPESNLFLERLNSGETFERKIVVYGGKMTQFGRVEDCLLGTGGLMACFAAIMTEALNVPQSDGIVPLKSALFESCINCVATRIYDGYDHGEIARGKPRFPWESDPLFEDIANNLLSLIMPRTAAFDGYADLGNSSDERFHSLSGWDRVNPGLLPRPDTDRTSRYQSLRGQSSIDLSVAETFTPYRLTFRSEAGYCDDSFSVSVNGRSVYTYTHKGLPDFPIHAVQIPAELVPVSRVRVTFQNLARDNCGLAAIYYVRLDPM